MPELILVSNPSRRPTRAQLRARRAFVSRFAKGTGPMSKKRRRVHRAKKSHRKYARNPVSFRKRRKHRYRRNPSLRGMGRGILGTIQRTAMDGAIGAAGGIAMDLAYGYTAPYLPEMMRAGAPKHLAKALMAVAVGLIGKRLMPRYATPIAVGGMTVELHAWAKELLLAQVPTLPLSEYLAYSPGSGEIVGTYGDQGLGALPDLSGGMQSLGFNSFETDTLGEYLTEAY